MNALKDIVRDVLFASELPPELTTLMLPSKGDRQNWIDQMRGCIDERERELYRLELSIGIAHTDPDLPWTGSNA